MGADVVKVEPPGGDPARALPPFRGDRPHPDGSLFFLYMNTSKRGVLLDLARPEGRRRFEGLVASAHVVIETFPPGHLDALGLGYARLRELNPGVVLTSITGFGQTGPHRAYRSCDLVASALGGAMYVTGREEDPPVKLAGSQAHAVASICGAAASLIALYHSARSGRGQHVDISVAEAVTSVTHICGVGKWLDDGIVPRRSGPGLFASVPSGTYRCRDGLVYLMINRPLHWKALASWIRETTGVEEILDPMFEGPSSRRQPYRELVDLWISEFTARFTVAEIYREGQGRHIAFTPVNGAAEVARDPQLAAREYFVEVDHPRAGRLRYPGAPYRHSRTPWRIARPAPRLGEHEREVFAGEAGPPHAPPPGGPTGIGRGARGGLAGEEPARMNGSRGALDGVRVVEFTSAMAGPWVGRFMAWCGAEVIRVESKSRPDVVRLYVPPRAPETGTQPQLSPWFTDWNAGKRFVALDLTRPEAVVLARRLVALSDVVVENQSAGVMDKLGLGYEELRTARPDLVMLSTSGYGDTGPCRRYVSWGPNIETLSGLSRLSGFSGRECTMTQFAYPDTVSALHGLFAVMCALDHRLRTGEGQYISLSQFESTVSVLGDVQMDFLANGREPPPRGNASLRAAPHGCYRCAGEDRWCAIAVFDDAQWGALGRVIERPQWADDPRLAGVAARLAHAEEIDRAIEEWTARRDPYEVMEAMQRAGVAAGVVQTAEDHMERDRQLRARGFLEEIEHLKKGRVVATGIPLGLTGTPGRSGRAGAALGQDNDPVFGGILGLSAEEIRRLVEIGAIETPEPE